MRFGKLDIDPAKNPAVLDTATWNHHRAWEVLGSQRTGFWRDFGAAAVAGRRLLAAPAVTPTRRLAQAGKAASSAWPRSPMANRFCWRWAREAGGPCWGSRWAACPSVKGSKMR